MDDAPQRRLVPVLPVGLLFLRVHPQVLLYVLFDGDPAIVNVDTWTEDVDFLKYASILLQDEADQRHGFAGLAGPEENARAWDQGHHGVRGLLAAVFWRGEYLDLPHSFFCLYFRNSKPQRGARLCRGGRAGACGV